jgi:hypothetical protein
MAYTTIDKPNDYFNTVLYTGTGASNSVTGVGFQSDLLWFKNRSSALNHILFDSVRGIDKYFYVNLNEAEGTSATILTAVGSDGFTVGANNNVNQSSNGIVAWNWLANGAGVSNTAGTISSTVSANTTSGFSIVSYTGTGANATVGHGLGVAPNVVIIKERTSAGEWVFGHSSLGFTKFIELNSAGASQTSSTRFNDTAPTSLLFSIGTAADVNTSTNAHIAYCFADVKGFSKFGSYTGNGSTDGTFVYTGFKPAFVIVKRSDAGGANWQMIDNKRSDAGGNNIIDKVLAPNANDAEYDEGSSAWCGDLLSNGFKWRGDWSALNTSGGTYIYMAFAENPFVTSTSIPTTAR